MGYLRKTSTSGRCGGLLGLELGLGLGEDRGLLDREAHPQADGDEHGAQQERDAPAPRLEGGVGLDGREDPQHTGGEQVAQRHAGLRPRGPEAALRVVAVLGGHQDGAAPLAADREALHQAAGQQEERGGDADGGVRRQQADREGRDAHQEERSDEHLLAADPVTEVAEDDAAEGAGDEAERVGAEGQQGRGGGLALGEEQRAEDERRGRAVEEEVVPLDGGADQGGEDDLDDVGASRLGARTPRVPVGAGGVGAHDVPFMGGDQEAWRGGAQAAVQPPSREQGGAGHRRRGRAAQEGHRVGDLLGLDEPLERGAGEQDGVEDLVLGDAVGARLVGELALDQRRADVAGADGVAGDALVRPPRAR